MMNATTNAAQARAGPYTNAPVIAASTVRSLVCENVLTSQPPPNAPARYPAMATSSDSPIRFSKS